MSLNGSLLLVAAALLPAIVLCIYVFKKDRVEKEPLGLLLLLLIYGAISCYPAAFIEGLLGEYIDAFFYDSFLLHTFVTMFFGVALVEEGVKYIGLNWLTKKNPEFNCLFDGLIYSVFVSLGFAALENVLYVVEYGWINALMRAVLSVPGHMFFAVLMGYNYSLAHITDKAAAIEKQLVADGYVVQKGLPFSSAKHRFMSMLMPVLAHGAYNFCCSLGTAMATLGMLVIIICLYIHCFGKIKKMSAGDGDTTDYAIRMFSRKYPEMSGRIENPTSLDAQPGDAE